MACCLSATVIADSDTGSVSLMQDHTEFVDGLIAKETQPVPVVRTQAEPSGEAEDPALLGASEQSMPVFKPSVHFVGITRMGKEAMKAHIYYRGTSADYKKNQRLPTGQLLVAITHTSITLKDEKGNEQVLPMTSQKEAQNERERFQNDQQFYQSLGLGVTR